MGSRIASTADISHEAIISKFSEVHHHARLEGTVILEGACIVENRAQVVGPVSLNNVWISDSAKVGGGGGDITINGCDSPMGIRTHIAGNAIIYAPKGTSLNLSGPLSLGDDCEITDLRHYLCLGPIGREYRYVTLHRTVGGNHRVMVGCWQKDKGGTLGELRDRVLAQHTGRHLDEYMAFIGLAQIRANEWVQEQ